MLDSDNDDPVRQETSKVNQAIHKCLVDRISQLQEKDELASDCAPEALAGTLVCLNIGRWLISNVYSLDYEDVESQLREVLNQSVLRKSSGEKG